MSSNLNKYSKEELEKIKLVFEIRNQKLLRQPAFWTFIVVSITAFIGFYTGVFQVEKALIKLDNEKLNMRKDKLSKQVDSLENTYLLLENQYDSLYTLANNLERQQDSIKHVYRIWKKTKQSKVALAREVENFISSLRDLIKQSEINEPHFNTIKSSQSKAIQDSIWHVNINKSLSTSRELQSKYAKKYKIKAITYKEKMETFLPNHKPKTSNFQFIHPTNLLGIIAITDELEHMLYKLKN